MQFCVEIKSSLKKDRVGELTRMNLQLLWHNFIIKKHTQNLVIVHWINTKASGNCIFNISVTFIFIKIFMFYYLYTIKSLGGIKINKKMAKGHCWEVIICPSVVNIKLEILIIKFQFVIFLGSFIFCQFRMN